MPPPNSIETPIIETLLGVEFSDETLLTQALTRASWTHEHPEVALESNERLEFLGDAILGFIIADELYKSYPQMAEGEMTTTRAQLVSTRALAAVAREMDLGAHLRLGQGEEMSGGRTNAKNLAGAFEALIGAVWLDAGLEAARTSVIGRLNARICTVTSGGGDTDYKSRLQEITQARLQVQPRYETASMLSDTGAPVFSTKVIIGGRAMGRGTGASKREAQREAARQALERFADP
jgi:ribonuclease-3